MTGSRRRPATHSLWLGGLILAGPALAQNTGAPASPAPPDVPAVVSQPVSAAPPPAGPAPPPLGPLPPATFRSDSVSGPLSAPVFEGAHLNYNGELTVDADRLRGDLATSRYDATGHVFAHERDTTLRADRLHVNGLSDLGFSLHAFLTRRPYKLSADRIDFQPGRLVATRADATTAPPDDTNPDIGLLADTLVVTPVFDKNGVLDPHREHLDMRNPKLYLLHNRVLTLRHYQTTVGTDPKKNQEQPSRPTFGYSGRYGFFAGYGGSTVVDRARVNYSAIVPVRQTLQLRATSSQTLATALPPRPAGPPPPPGAPVTPSLAALRALTTAPLLPLPDGDPLLLHDFLPDTGPIQLFNQPPPAYLVASEEVSSHQESSGRNGRNDLYVSRLPDINLYSAVPLNRVSLLPTGGDPRAFRHALRQPALYAGVNGEAARFYEAPDGISATRETIALRLFTQPILIAPNTVLLPAYTYAFNHYTGVSGGQYYRTVNGRQFPNRELDYGQFSVAVNHYFSNYSGIGAQFFDNQTRGDSPLNFDVFGASRELDGRLQVGDRRLAVAGAVRYDVLYHHVLDYTLTVAPGLRGFTPVFSYRFFSQSFGVSLAIPGLTF